MVFNFKVSQADFSKVIEGIEDGVARATMRAMDRATVDVKADLGAQMTQAGFSARFSKAWDRNVYPASGRLSLNPAGYVKSKAPEIIDAFTRGATIRPVHGSRYLWIPTKNVPRARRRVLGGGGIARAGALTPSEVEDRFGDFIYLHEKGGGLGAYVEAIRGRNGRSERRATAGRLAQGRDRRLVRMFSLRKSVRMPKLLDLSQPAELGASAFVNYLSDELGKL